MISLIASRKFYTDYIKTVKAQIMFHSTLKKIKDVKPSYKFIKPRNYNNTKHFSLRW